MSQTRPRFPVVAFSPAGWVLEAESEDDDDFGTASPWDDLRDWQGLEVFDSSGHRFVAARAFRVWPRSRLGLWIARIFRHSIHLGFEWETPDVVPLMELRRRLETAYPAAGFESDMSNHETLIRRCL
jgi:hypothetical protein